MKFERFSHLTLHHPSGNYQTIVKRIISEEHKWTMSYSKNQSKLLLVHKMSRKLTPSLRRQIISDYKNGIQNEEYRVIDQGIGKYQVRKRESKFKIQPKLIPQTEQKEEEEKKESPIRMSNEDLLYKLSNLLQVPQKEPKETSEEN